MITYMNENLQRVAVEDEEVIAIFEKVDTILINLPDDQFNKMLEIVGDYMWEGGVANANRVRGLAKRIGIDWRDLTLWYCLED